MAQKVFITGKPGCGKTTLIKELVKERDVAGFITEEIRDKGRKGFKIIDIKSREEGVLASTEQKTGPRVSKYRVNLADLERIGIKALERKADLIVIDEIGKMELYSKAIEKKIKEILQSRKKVLATLHRNYIDEYRKYGEVIWLTRENWQEVFERLKGMI
ncbi:MAG: NTPase [Candidatus Aenigmatarchaeota archaeon]